MDAAGAGGRGPIFPMQQQVPSLPFPPSPPLTPYYSSSLSSSSPASAASHHASLSITSLPILLLTVLGILTASALLLAYYVFVIRCCLTWHVSDSSSHASHSRRRRGRPGAADLPVVRGALAEARGLEAPAIQALPAFRYRKASKNDTAVESGECAVCLGEFQEEERVRLLPGCLHVFHVDCIDTWLHGNANCPLCRAAITTTTTTGGQLPLMDQVLRPEEVVIQVQVAGTEEEANTAAAGSQGDAADQRVGSKGEECIAERKKISKNNTRFHGDGSDSSSSSTL